MTDHATRPAKLPPHQREWPEVKLRLDPALLARLDKICEERIVGRQLVLHRAAEAFVAKLEGQTYEETPS